MFAHVLLNILNKLKRSDKMRGLLSIGSIFHNDINTINDTEARILDFIHHITLYLLCNRIVGVKKLIFCHCVRSVAIETNRLRYLNMKPLVVYRFYSIALSQSQMRIIYKNNRNLR